MIQTMVNVYQVKVVFNATASTFSYSGDMVYHLGGVPALSIPSGIHIINFTLETTDPRPGVVGSATFPSAEQAPFPITFPDFVSAESEIASPLNYVPNDWRNESYCSLVAMNLNHIPNEAHPRGFVVTVYYDSEPYTSADPTIINDPPAQGSGF
jgi:hypothetical protein